MRPNLCSFKFTNKLSGWLWKKEKNQSTMVLTKKFLVLTRVVVVGWVLDFQGKTFGWFLVLFK
jgi:hypothetical protein